MKKLLLLLFVCCTAFACEQNDAVQPQNTTKQATKSKYRTLDDAIDIAEKSVSMLGEPTRATKRSIDRSRIRAVLDRRATTRSAAADTLIYIINFDDSAGFALVPRSTSKPELLAITEKGNYDGEETDNEGFNIYMDRAFEWIVDSTHDGQPIDTTFNPGVGGGGIGDQVITEWKSETIYDTLNIGPLLTTQWDQNEPFNNFCFLNGASSGEPAYAGCTAIAVAQIMAYHEYPYTTTLTYPFAHVNSIPLNWDTWKTNVYLDQTGIAAFIREIGEQIEMEYELGRSGAWLSDARLYMQRIGYECGEYQDYSQTSAINSIILSRPVPVQAYRYDENNKLKGHTWVIDGYKAIETTTKEWQRQINQTQWTLVNTIYRKNKYLHFNWGWAGTYDGLFFIETHTTGGVGGTHTQTEDFFSTNNPSLNYNLYVDIVPNIHRNN